MSADQLKKQEEKEQLLKKLADEAQAQLDERNRKKKDIDEREKEEQAQIKERMEHLRQKELMVTQIVAEQGFLILPFSHIPHLYLALCTLGVRYSEKTVIVSWSLGKDLQGLPADWVGFFKLGEPNTKYRQYIKTGTAPTPTARSRLPSLTLSCRWKTSWKSPLHCP